MKISKLENDMLKIAVGISRFKNGDPVFLADLRELLPGMSKNDFDQAILTMAENGYFLTKHFHPAQATDAEKESFFIPDGEGNFYIAINPRDDAKIPKEPPKAAPVRRGGSREGAGRPAIKTKTKRVPLAGARIPGWLMDWLRDQGNMGGRIEAALIEKYKLTPPS